MVCAATRTTLASTIAASHSSLSPSSDHRRAGSTAANQSTTRPSMANSRASKAPMLAVSTIMMAMKGRVPSVPAHKKGKKRFGAGLGEVSG